MKKRVLSLMLCLCMAISLLPTTARAADYTTPGGLTITGFQSNVDYFDDGIGTLSILKSGSYTISGSSTTDTIYVEPMDDGEVNITLDGVNIDASSTTVDYSAFGIKPNITVNLTLKGDNILTSKSGYAGLEVPEGATLNITDVSTGTLTATGGSQGAGIGGSTGSGTAESPTPTGCGTIRILGGNVNAVAGNSNSEAAIGYGSIYSNQGTLTGTGNATLIPIPTVVTLDGVTDAGETVSDLVISGYSFPDMTTLAGGVLYLWLPDCTSVTGAIANGKQYSGSVTAGSTGTLQEVPAVASVTPSGGGTPTNYTDFAAALTAAQASNGSTLKLLADYSGTVTVSGGEFTLDLNGKTLTGTKGKKEGDVEIPSQPGLLLKESANVTLRATGGGQIIGGAGRDEVNENESAICGSTAVYVKAGCTFTVYGGTLKSGACGMWSVSPPQYNPSYSEVIVTESGGTTALFGGTYTLDISNAGSTSSLFQGDGSLPTFYRFYDSEHKMLTETALNAVPFDTETVTVGERDFSDAITYDSGTKTYTVLSPDGLRWLSAFSNNTVTADTFQNDPAMPAYQFDGNTVRLGADIDLSGADWTPIPFFKGTFDGAGHRITNMAVNTIDNGGLFATLLGNAAVKNLSVSGSVTVAAGESCLCTAGGIAGFASNSPVETQSMENCTADIAVSLSGAMSASDNSAAAGGLVGYTDVSGSFSMQNCYFRGTVSNTATNTNEGSYTGALVGYCKLAANDTVKLVNCYASQSGALINNSTADGYTPTLNSIGTYDASGNLTAANDTTLEYGTTLANAMKYWVNRQGDTAVNYVAWTADTVPVLTTTYATASAASYGDWTKQADGSYTRIDANTGITQTAEVLLIAAGGTETPYATLEEAITAAQSASGSTVRLLSDVTTDAEVDVASGTFTIDLNGKTWSSAPTGANGVVLWIGGGNVTMKDSGTNGTFTSVANSSASGTCATLYVDGGSVTIESGIYQITGGSGDAIYIDNSSDKPNVKISGGTLTSLKTNNGSTVGELLADGYSYRNTVDSTWVNNINTNMLNDVSVQLAPVKITAQSQDVTVTYGYTDPIVLSVAVQTVPENSGKAITYQWHVEGGILSGDVTSASFTVPTGLPVGSDTYYCAVTCDGCTVSSKTVTVTVSKTTGIVANKEIDGYPTVQTYNGIGVNPTDSHFETNTDTHLTFKWYAGQNEDGSITNLSELTQISEPVNAGKYTLKVDVEDTQNVTAASTILKVTIGKADPNVGNVVDNGSTLYTSTAPYDVTLISANNAQGTLVLDGVTALAKGTNIYNWKFTPTDTNNYEIVTGTVNLTVSEDTLQSISSSGTPSKTTYIYGDAFDKNGLTVTAHYESGATKDVTASVTASALAVGDTSALLSYTEDGVTTTCTVSGLTVNKKAGNNQPTSVSLNYTNTQAQTVDLSGFIPSDCGDISEIVVETTGDPQNIIASVSGDKSAKTASFTLTSDLASGEQSATLTATIKSQNYADFTVTITVNTTNKTAVTITGVTAQNGTYNGSTHTGYNGTPSSSYTGTYEITYSGRNGTTYTSTTAPKNAGDYTVTFKVPDSDNTYAGSIDIPFSIGKVTVVATADNKSITTGGTLPNFTVSYTGIVSGDTAASIFATQATASCTADGKTSGSYPITASTPALKDEAAKNYIVGTCVNGTLTVSAPSSGDSSASSSTTNTVTVPVSSDAGKASVSVSISGTTATISVTDSQLSTIASTAKKAGTVTVDVSSLKVDAAAIPSEVISAAQKAEGSTGLEVVLPTGAVTLDKAALEAVSDKGDVKISVDTVSNSKLTDTQKAVLGNQAGTALIVNVTLYAGGTKISTFGDGKLSVSVPYTLKSGESADSITVWFVKDDGTLEPKNGTYNAATGRVEFTTGHLSQYLIVSFPFTDVAEDAWYYGSVAYAYNNGLFAGTSATTFSPDTAMTRQMIWMVLASMDGKTPADMDAARTWAMENGISDGSNLENPITREQMAAILYRYAQYRGYDTTQGGMAIREFADYDSISEYALTALGWSVNAGLMQGSDNNLMPAGSATRAQVATILQRLCQNVAK